ncbi:hypothetical protein [Pontibacter sp. BAB1700]|uniref:hypothetical protein n=1 Tax=Pontibacter sp. BAB1700 TaxID=1144253 RepID=UPI00026BCDB8|nr:hypothetical protein [Pontibacter sp. BAB1700]EJF10135.1 hypothetical protein O71_10894 [Pontibacter sp. BAB1700]
MLRQIKIKQINAIKKRTKGNRFLNPLLTIANLAIYPIIVIGGLIIMLFAGLLSFFQRLTMTKEEKEQMKVLFAGGSAAEQWTVWKEVNGLKLYQKYNGEVRFGPAYFLLKSEPFIYGLSDKVYGDWFFQYGEGLFLQQWNSIDTPNTNLLFINSETLELSIIEKNVPSVLWEMVKIDNKSVQLNCDTGREILKYRIDIKKSDS